MYGMFGYCSDNNNVVPSMVEQKGLYQVWYEPFCRKLWLDCATEI